MSGLGWTYSLKWYGVKVKNLKSLQKLMNMSVEWEALDIVTMKQRTIQRSNNGNRILSAVNTEERHDVSQFRKSGRACRLT